MATLGHMKLYNSRLPVKCTSSLLNVQIVALLLWALARRDRESAEKVLYTTLAPFVVIGILWIVDHVKEQAKFQRRKMKICGTKIKKSCKSIGRSMGGSRSSWY
jgi:hypothetical protein